MSETGHISIKPICSLKKMSGFFEPPQDTHLEFCEYDTENCPWGSAHCTCKDFLDIDDSDERRNTRLT